jgi:PPP family 3-phenylpropionic acid transporter
VTLAAVLACTCGCPTCARSAGGARRARKEPIGPVLRQPVVRWFFASLFFHVMAHFAIYGFLSLYLDAIGYGKGTIGALWAVSVVVEIAWFFLQGRLIGRCRCRAGC